MVHDIEAHGGWRFTQETRVHNMFEGFFCVLMFCNFCQVSGSKLRVETVLKPLGFRA